MSKIKYSKKLLQELNSIKNLEDYTFVYEVEDSRIGPETSDCSFAEFVLLGHPKKDEYIYLSTVKYGHLPEAEIHIQNGTKETFLDKSNYINTNGFVNDWHKAGSNAILDFEKFKYMQHLEENLSASKPIKQNKI